MDLLLDRAFDLDLAPELAGGRAPGKSTLTSRLAAPVVFRVADPSTAKALGEAMSGGRRGQPANAEQAAEPAKATPPATAQPAAATAGQGATGGRLPGVDDPFGMHLVTTGAKLAEQALAEADRLVAGGEPVKGASPPAAALEATAQPRTPRGPRGSTRDAASSEATHAPVARKAGAELGLAPDAAEAVEAAASSTGAPLPEALRRKYEASLGADLAGVRLHTGAASVAATTATAARAYTTGQDIHFNAGQLDPGSAAGESLLAHEVAHTVQQGPGLARKAELEVSSPDDACEVEADRAAEAMVAGRPAQVSMASGVARAPLMRAPNSYSEQKGGLKWNNGNELAKEEAEQFVQKKAELAGKLAGLASKLDLFGAKQLDPGTVLKSFITAKTQLEDELATIRQNIAFITIALFHGRYTPEEVPGVKRNLERLMALLLRMQATNTSSWFDVVQDSIAFCSSANEVAGQVASAGKTIGKATSDIVTEKFESISDYVGKIDVGLKAIDLAANVCDTSALDAFTSRPSQATCQAWAIKVGTIFEKIGNLVPSLPAGIDIVITGSLSMPSVVINKFIEIETKHYARYDAAIGSVGQGEILPDGGQGRPEIIGR